MKEPKYSITVFEDYAVIKGWIDVKIFSQIIKMMKYEGLTIMSSNEDGEGFKFARRPNENNLS